MVKKGETSFILCNNLKNSFVTFKFPQYYLISIVHFGDYNMRTILYKTAIVQTADSTELLFRPGPFNPNTISVTWLDLNKLRPLEKTLAAYTGNDSITPTLIAYRVARALLTNKVSELEFPHVLGMEDSKILFSAFDYQLIQELSKLGVNRIPVMGWDKLDQIKLLYGLDGSAKNTSAEWQIDSDYMPDPLPSHTTVSVNVGTLIEAVRSQTRMFFNQKGDMDRAESRARELMTPEVEKILEGLVSVKGNLNSPFDYEPAQDSVEFSQYYQAVMRVSDVRKSFKTYERFPETISELVGIVMNGVESVRVGNIYDTDQLRTAFQQTRHLLPVQDAQSEDFAWSMVSSFNHLMYLQPPDETILAFGIELGEGNGFEVAQRTVAAKIANNPYGLDIAQRALPQAQLDVLGRYIGQPLRSMTTQAAATEFIPKNSLR